MDIPAALAAAERSALEGVARLAGLLGAPSESGDAKELRRLFSIALSELLLASDLDGAIIYEEAGHGTRLELVSLSVLTTPTAKSVTEVRRTYERRDERLWYRLDMAAVGEPLGFHLEAELHPG